MPRNKLPDFGDCPLPDALDTIGERWSFLILRGALFGMRHFEDFQSSLGIARNILSNRLSRLVKRGILDRKVMPCDKRKVEYRLTEKGAALATVMLALRQWAEKWESGNPCSTVFADCRDRKPVRDIVIMAHDGRPLSPRDVMWIGGNCEEETEMSILTGES